jgi:hypothetical protein
VGVRRLYLGVTMSLHKLTAGSGYDYLTRQVAALDAIEKGHECPRDRSTLRGSITAILLAFEARSVTACAPVRLPELWWFRPLGHRGDTGLSRG